MSPTTARSQSESGSTESPSRVSILPSCPEDLLPMSYSRGWRDNGADRLDRSNVPTDTLSSHPPNSTADLLRSLHDDQISKITTTSTSNEVDGPVSKRNTPVEDVKMSLHRSRRSMSGSPAHTSESTALSLAAANRSMQMEFSSIRVSSKAFCFCFP